MRRRSRELVNIMQEFSVPLIFGVFCAMIFANKDYNFYYKLTHYPLVDLGEIFSAVKADFHHHVSGWKKYFTMHFIINDIFMVIFFGIATKEIVESFLPGGALNPLRKAGNPLMATIGGILGPVFVFFLFNGFMGKDEWAKGWGIVTATDIALAWLVAKIIFGKSHPAISFLLLLAIADDAIGLGIIAFAYPDPDNPTVWLNTIWIIPAMALAYFFRFKKIHSWVPYIFICGVISWWGLYSANLHPALALVPIVPFLPAPLKDLGLFIELEEGKGEKVLEKSTLENFEHDLKIYVDFGLFFFALVNAGVPFSNINNLSYIILISLVLGKLLGIFVCSYLAHILGFPLADGLRKRDLVLIGIIAGMGLTVALFISEQAFVNPIYKGAAKMGALFSGFAFIIAMILAKFMGIKKRID